MAKDQLVLMKDTIHKLLIFLLEGIQNENQLLAAVYLMTCSGYEDVMAELKIANSSLWLGHIYCSSSVY